MASNFVESQDYLAVRQYVEDSDIRVVIVYGDHGIGKTCLARQLLSDLVELGNNWKTYTIHTRSRDMYQMSSQAIIRSERGSKKFPPNYKPEIFELADNLWSEGDTPLSDRDTLLLHLDELQLKDEEPDMYWPKLTRVEHEAVKHEADETFDTTWQTDVINQLKECTKRVKTEKPKIKMLLTLKRMPPTMKDELTSKDVVYYEMKGFSPQNTADFLRSYTNSDIVLQKSRDINYACGHVPLLHKAVGYAFSAMNDPDEVEEYLENIKQQKEELMSVYQPSMMVLRNIPQLAIWKVVRQLGRTLIPKDFIIAIIIEYKYSTDSMKPKDRFVDQLRSSTDIYAMMRSDFMKNELMAENREGVLREQIYSTIHQITWKQLDTLIKEDPEEIQFLYKRLALRAIAAVIEFDDRFHAYTKETPSKLSYAQNHTMSLLKNLSENQPENFGGFETLLYYRLLLGVYYPKRKLGTATITDIDDLRKSVEAFEKVINSDREGNDIDKGRLDFDEESRKLCEVWLKRQRFTDRDKDFIIKYLKHVKVKVDPRRHLQNEDYTSKSDLIVELRKAKLLLEEEVYHKVIFEETRAVMYVLLSKMKGHNRSSIGSKMNELKDEDLIKACDIFTRLEKENREVVFLQHVILRRDRLILELPDDKTLDDESPDNEQDLKKVIKKCDELIENYEKLYTPTPPDSENSLFAYEFGFARSKPSHDSYHKLVCLEKILDIHGRKVLALRRRGGGDEEKQCYEDASKVLTKMKECIDEEEANNQPRAYAYALRHVAGFLSSIEEVELALRYNSYALTRLQQYSMVIKEMPISKEVEMPIYGKMCETIIKLKESKRSPERRPGVEIFENCLCISRLNEPTDPSTQCECKVDYMLENYIKPMLKELVAHPNRYIVDALKFLSQEFGTAAAVSE